MAYKIDITKCLKCGLCVSRCPQNAIKAGKPRPVIANFVVVATSIDPQKCNDCGVCVSEEWWCPAKAIYKV
ncbi:MAG: 4Fe-4S binding protein [Dehalococcoidales bacterium]|nr:4Fe-4S binding protein [Dehalococcoidales bacterium]